jgi:hypothetical protein
MNAYTNTFEEERRAVAASERWAQAKVVELERNAANVREGLRLMDTALIRGADCRRWRRDPRWRE